MGSPLAGRRVIVCLKWDILCSLGMSTMIYAGLSVFSCHIKTTNFGLISLPAAYSSGIHL
jgi:hypothetical protein